jgi:hypothetical protein
MNSGSKLGLAVALLSGFLVACGGGGSNTTTSAATTPPAVTPTTLGGVAAIGAPIVGGTVSVVCAGGSTLSSTTSSTGGWTVTITDQTLPCATQVKNGTISGVANTQLYHAAALAFGTVNITPLTDLIVANMLGSSPSTWFAGLSTTSRPVITGATLDAARTRVINSLGMTSTLNGGNPLTATFTAAPGNLYDDALRAMSAAFATAGTSFAQMLTAVGANPTSFVVPAGYNFAVSYAGVTVSTGTTTPVAGSLVVSVTALGVATPPVTVNPATAPASQTAFCGTMTSDATFASLAKTGGGTFTINSCTFTGKVGVVNATLVITAPIALTIPYVITYTYQ